MRRLDRSIALDIASMPMARSGRTVTESQHFRQLASCTIAGRREGFE
jgi:hypothetical protein